MEAKQAVAIAKRYLADIMSDEAIEAPTLEEVWLAKSLWRVTLGVRRKFSPDSAAGRVGLTSLPNYKTVTIADKDGRVISVRERLLQSLEP